MRCALDTGLMAPGRSTRCILLAGRSVNTPLMDAESKVRSGFQLLEPPKRGNWTQSLPRRLSQVQFALSDQRSNHWTAAGATCCYTCARRNRRRLLPASLLRWAQVGDVAGAFGKVHTTGHPLLLASLYLCYCASPSPLARAMTSCKERQARESAIGSELCIHRCARKEQNCALLYLCAVTTMAAAVRRMLQCAAVALPSSRLGTLASVLIGMRRILSVKDTTDGRTTALV
jgi:hypothetical protein